jgi:hypothetical protein
VNIDERINRLYMLIFVILTTSLLLTIIGSLVVNNGSNKEWWVGFLMNWGTETYGIAIGSVLIVMFFRRAEKALEQSAQKTQQAVDSLQNVYAVLKMAQFRGASLKGAQFRGADLQGADFTKADLQGANFTEANLQEANFIDANLQEADFRLAAHNGLSLLPDGSSWTPDTDITRFTDPNHPNFWRSADPESPAYRDDAEEGNDK